jgi:hypothetical protein
MAAEEHDSNCDLPEDLSGGSHPVGTGVEAQLQGVQRNHDQIKMLRDQFRAAR